MHSLFSRSSAIVLLLLLTSLLTFSLTSIEAAPYIEPPYDDSADGNVLIKEAQKKAAKENKGILISWGRNSCRSCVQLHRYFETHDFTNELLEDNYVRVSINTSTNRALMANMNVRPVTVPYLTVLDSNGVKLTDHDPSSMLRDSTAVYYFLRRYASVAKQAPKWTPAEQKLVDALENLSGKNRRIFVVFGSTSCDWCPALNSFLRNRTVRAILEKDFDFVDMNQSTLPGAFDLQKYLSGNARKNWLPWYAIMDKQGNVLTTATGPQGTIGYPADQTGIAHFMAMLKGSSTTITESEFKTIEDKLKATAKELRF